MGEGEEAPVSNLKVYSLEEVKKHAKGGSEKDVWIVIHDNVYNVTKFLDKHPGFLFGGRDDGDEDPLFSAAGTDGTEPFEDQLHSLEARELLKEYLIGTLQESDRKGTVDKGPKSDEVFGQASPSDEGSNLMTWIVTAVLAFGGSMIYRMYFAKA